MNAVHPFPARMAPEVVFEALASERSGRRILDPMMGSGTTLVSGRLHGHHVTGVDRDPLAVLIASAASSDLNVDCFKAEAEKLLRSARRREARLKDANAYPSGADAESRAFLDYWFDLSARRQLTAMVRALEADHYQTRTFLTCAISRMIITKQGGVSLAEDISHSRPHRTRNRAKYLPFDLFPRAVRSISVNAPFVNGPSLPVARTLEGDCRNLPFQSNQFDYVITSPPYLNAIDYMRGHKMSLVWFGHAIHSLREIRGTNVGGSRGSSSDEFDAVLNKMVDVSGASERLLSTLRAYVADLALAIHEINRVLATDGTAVFVIGDSTVGGLPVKNSVALDLLCRKDNLRRVARRRRPIAQSRRYLPPPAKGSTTRGIATRMWDEVILTYQKTK